MFVDDDEYGLESFFPHQAVSNGLGGYSGSRLSVSAVVPKPSTASALHSSELGRAASSTQAIRTSRPTPPPPARERSLPAFPSSVNMHVPSVSRTVSPAVLSSTEVKLVMKPGGGNGTMLPLPKKPSVVSATPGQTAPLNSGERNRVPSRGLENPLDLGYSGYMLDLGLAEAPPPRAVSPRAGRYGSLYSVSYDMMLPPRSDIAVPSRENSGYLYPQAASVKITPASRKSSRDIVPSTKETASAMEHTSSQALFPGHTNKSSFFTRMAALNAHEGSSSDDSSEEAEDDRARDGVTAEAVSAASPGSPATVGPRGRDASSYDGASIFQDMSSTGSSSNGGDDDKNGSSGDDKDDLDDDRMNSADFDFMAQEAVTTTHASSHQEKDQPRARRPSKLTAPRRDRSAKDGGQGVGVQRRVSEEGERGVRGARRAAPAAHDTEEEHDRGTLAGAETVEGSPDQPSFAVQTRSAADGAMSSCRESEMDASLMTEVVTAPGRHNVNQDHVAHPHALQDVQLMNILRLTDEHREDGIRRSGGVDPHRLSASDGSGGGRVGAADDDLDDGDSQARAAVQRANHRALEGRQSAEDTPPGGVRAQAGGQRRRLARPAPDRRLTERKSRAAALPSVHDSNERYSAHTVAPPSASPPTASPPSSHSPPSARRTDRDTAGASASHSPPPLPPHPGTVALRAAPGGAAARSGRGGPPLQPQLIGAAAPDGGMHPMYMGGPGYARFGVAPGHPAMMSMSPQHRMAVPGTRRASVVNRPPAMMPMSSAGSPRVPGRRRADSEACSSSDVGSRSRGHSVASSVLSSVPSLHASDRFDAVANLRQFIDRQGPSPDIEDLDVLVGTPTRASALPSAITPASMFTHVGDTWFSEVATVIHWVSSPNLTPDSRPLL